MGKILSGDASPAEVEELDLKFLADPELKIQMEQILAMKELPPDGISSQDEQRMLDDGWKKMDSYFANQSASSVLKTELVPIMGGGRRSSFLAISSLRWIAAAAAVLFLVACSYFFWMHLLGKPAVQQEVTTRYGSRTFIHLPDGSKVWLNAGTTLTYEKPFVDGNRVLTLSGEAFFDVKHDPAHPFVIHVGKLDVKVLGTAFNVKAYPDDSLMETTLIRGRVEIDFTNHSRSAIILKPSEKVVINTLVKKISSSASGHPDTLKNSFTPPMFILSKVAGDSVDGNLEETSWVQNKLVFRKESFGRLALQLERWYNVRIQFENEKYQDQLFTGIFKDQPINEVMQALEVSADFHYKITGNKIQIW
ncbi:MAG: FecR family protein [Chitinophagaceae bacterium]